MFLNKGEKLSFEIAKFIPVAMWFRHYSSKMQYYYYAYLLKDRRLRLIIWIMANNLNMMTIWI
jgi:hypothetical protein